MKNDYTGANPTITGRLFRFATRRTKSPVLNSKSPIPNSNRVGAGGDHRFEVRNHLSRKRGALPAHSARSTDAGFIRVARLAGHWQATNAAIRKQKDGSRNARGSSVLVP